MFSHTHPPDPKPEAEDPVDIPLQGPPDSRTPTRLSEPQSDQFDQSHQSYRLATLVTGTVLLSLLAITVLQAAKGGGGPDDGPLAEFARSGKVVPGVAQPAHSITDTKHWQDKRMWRQPGNWGGGRNWAHARANNWKRERASWPSRGGYGGALLPQADYRKNFSSANSFRIGAQPEMKNGYARFSRHGTRFMIVDPYPEGWNNNWHYYDEVYVSYYNGYYLHNRRHPGMPLAIMVLE